ncbi:TM2 domain-containing protein [Gluconobacter wancherniae]|uniref:Putative membrane protein YozV n=1 Tax=Gluconobacter wancherniae NBRC 103581 TaxID=656744 RepID=A0A511B2X2_9PROT|nr:TM2 domain-containing protein [Gluconobacter wancherniae]MBF0854314.1 TM2 domain-containing protein [Gluconobacter wancherniae]MBS1062711.1 TM2 domain-containing protein [Gluconobacter wancherniae]MBS1088554.1 TM2 domain-containing protein [Gluconobacter wancherniae]GBD57374.1 hypothetical protein NBRC103581_01962 [Gluconobacter wancherniae NBRC 103581]GBR62545.1 hypothetical protein AA103581_0361 [Gluconobacter wancherniae NBRC 103581]
MKKKSIATLLAMFLGTFGGHRFYLGSPILGLLYILFCWTGIPTIVSFIEMIILICMTDEEFDIKYNTEFMLQKQSFERMKEAGW